MLFPKENSSNGCVATVDVIYPAAPQFLLMGPTYAKALVAPALIYSTSPRWKFPFAPHDVGTYPQANGQVYGGGESSTNEADMMPVEESGNMILLCAAIAKMDGNADFATRFWPQLTRWEAYLEKYGEDPENQLCTDDFMGHLAHNANLSVKAILAIAAYGELCKMRGDAVAAAKYRTLARDNARHWMKMAGDGDHYRIAFDRPNTWSQKYNLVWDKLLGLDIFPPEVARQEVAYYKKAAPALRRAARLADPAHQDRLVPLERDPGDRPGRLRGDRRADLRLPRTTRPRALPFVDSYLTDNQRSDGMRARPVIGGVFIKMLEDPATWKKWAGRDRFTLGELRAGAHPAEDHRRGADVARTVVPWRYTTRARGRLDSSPASTTSAGSEGPGGFGTAGTPGHPRGTDAGTRPTSGSAARSPCPPSIDAVRVQLALYHDEDAEVYVDGILAAREPGYVDDYQTVEIAQAARALLKPGARVVLAVHCHQTGGGQGIDVGLVDVQEVRP